MNDFRQKLLSAGLSAFVLLGACAPLTAMAAQMPAPQAQTAGTGAAQTSAGTPGQITQLQTSSGGTRQGADAAQTGQSQTEGQESENEAAQQAKLAAQARITEAEAIAAAQAVYPGGTVTVEELDGENGVVTYELKIQPADGGKTLEAAVDAVTGELLASESDD